MTNSIARPISITRNWNIQKVKLQAIFINLTDSDLRLLPGKEEFMLNNIQNKLGKTRYELTALIIGL